MLKPQSKYPRVKTKTRGQVSEIAVFAPIRMGRVPGERRTFEERLRDVIRRIDERSAKGVPSPLNLIQTVHYGRLLVIRPEQYLHYNRFNDGRREVDPSEKKIPSAYDPYEMSMMSSAAPDGKPVPGVEDHRSYLLTIVSFDGDLKPYFRDIADFLRDDFDLMFENCEDFDTTADFEGFWAWIRRYQISVDLFFPAYPDLSVAEIKRLQVFKARFDDLVAKIYGETGRSTAEIGALFEDFLRQNHHYGSGFPNDAGLYPSLQETE